ncbi:MAG TPA: hypothetical protein VM933_10650 [Acidimicrobiales bacterium]|nr:hypothetical protein [Acidimicrobiales bacterium]
METQRFVNPSHPQTLVIGTYLLYFDAFFTALSAFRFGVPFLFLIAAGAAVAGWGIANDKRWAYWLGIVVSGFGVLVNLGNILGLMFAVAQAALLLHPMSREYQKIWFR